VQNEREHQVGDLIFPLHPLTFLISSKAIMEMPFFLYLTHSISLFHSISLTLSSLVAREEKEREWERNLMMMKLLEAKSSFVYAHWMTQNY
jgi:hypothetical protein